MKNGMFTWSLSDVQKGLIMAVLGGAFLPIAAIVQTPGFSITSVNWSAVLDLSLTGAAVSFVGYMVKNFFSTHDGAVFGRIGKSNQ